MHGIGSFREPTNTYHTALFMCRLYGLQASHPTRVACELLDSQNALINQSRQDARGLSNLHGWGIGHKTEGDMVCARQVDPASESSSYRTQALHTKSRMVMAHIRRATVGQPKQFNTHPFRHERALLIHNGHIPSFDKIRPHLLEYLDPGRRTTIQGETDSEHILALLLQLRAEAPRDTLRSVTREAVRRVQAWVDAEAPDATAEATLDDTDALSHDELKRVLGLNLIWTDGHAVSGARFNRSLWTLQRDQVPICAICHQKHAHPPDGVAYQSTTLASERLTDEAWSEVPNGSVFHIQPNGSPDFSSPTAW